MAKVKEEVREGLPLRRWATRLLLRCRDGMVDLNHPDAVDAASIFGFHRAVAFVSRRPKHCDAMHRRVAGSFGAGRRN